MQRLSKKILLICGCALLTAAVLVLGACTSASQTAASSGSGTLKVGVRAEVVCFGYLSEQTGNYYGLEVDIAKEMATRMGYADVEFVTATVENREQLLTSGEADVLLACYSVTDERRQKFDFSDAYYEDAPVLMVENSSLIDSLSDLKGCTIGARAGASVIDDLCSLLENKKLTGSLKSSSDDAIVYEKLSIVGRDSYAILSQQLEEGSLDAIVMDGSLAATYIEDNRSCITTGLEGQSYAAATVKGSDLSESVSAAIAEMLADGTIDSIVNKWLA